MIDKLTIVGYSTALYSTWINIQELDLLFDAGDGLCAGLMQKTGKIKHVFISHADRDHLSGLLQFVQLNSRNNLPVIHYPKDSGSFLALRDFMAKFDPHATGSLWKPISDKSSSPFKSGYEIEAIRNNHIPAPPGIDKSLSFKLHYTKKKLKSEFAHLSPEEIKQIVSDKGRDFITTPVKTNVLSYSGDTPIENYARWDQSDILIHEATFINEDNVKINDAAYGKHSTLQQVMEMVREISVGKVILTHFSTRYSKLQIKEAILEQIKAYNIKVPIYVIYPGEINRDVLASEPINN